MIHCPCENELVYLLEKTVMLEEKYLPGKYKYKFTVMNEAETMKHAGFLVLAPAVFAHRNYLKPQDYVCSVPSSDLDKTPAHTCAYQFNSGHPLAHIKAGSATLKFMRSRVMQVYDMDMHSCIFILRAFQSNEL